MNSLKSFKLLTKPLQWGNQYGYHHIYKINRNVFDHSLPKKQYLGNIYSFSGTPKLNPEPPQQAQPVSPTANSEQTNKQTEQTENQPQSSFFDLFKSKEVVVQQQQVVVDKDIVHADFDDWNNYFQQTYETVFQGLGVSLIAMFFPFPSIYNGFPISLNIINMFFYYLARIKPDEGTKPGKFDHLFKDKLVQIFYRDPDSYDFNQKVYFHVGNLIQGMHHPLINICIAGFTFLNFLPLYFNPQGQQRTEQLSQKIVGGYIQKVGGFLALTLALNFYIVEQHFLPWTFTQYMATIISPVVLGAILLWLAQRKLYKQGVDHISNASDYFNAILIIQLFIYGTLGLEVAKYLVDQYKTVQRGRDIGQ